MRDKYIHMTSRQLKREKIKKERYEKQLKKSVAKEIANNKPVKSKDPFLDAYNLTGKDIESNKAKINIANKYRSDLIINKTAAESMFLESMAGEDFKMNFEFQKIIYIHNKYKIDKFYIADFYFPRMNLIVELDGGYHDSSDQKGKDWERTKELMKAGYFVLRFNNNEVYKPIDVFCKIMAYKQKFKMNGRKCNYNEKLNN